MRVQATRAGRRRTGFSWTTAILSGFMVVVLVCLLAGAIFLLSPSNRAAASFIHPQPGSIHWNKRTPLTMLFLGASEQSKPVADLAVVSFDPTSRSIQVLSVPPSLWVTIPGFGQDRIADAY